MAERLFDHLTVDNDEAKLDGSIIKNLDNNAEFSSLKEDFNDKVNSAYVTDSADGAVAHFVDGADNVPLKSLKVNIEPVQSGSGDPSPSNVRPISGWSSVKVTRAGKNVLMPPTVSTTTHNGITFTYMSDGGIKCNGTSTGVAYSSKQNDFRLQVGQYTKNPQDTNGVGVIVQTMTTPDWTSVQGGGVADRTVVIAEEDAEYTLAVRIRVPSGITLTNYVIYPMLRLVSDTDDTYEPYNGNTYTINLSSAGTVYGGTLDVVSGELVVDRAIKTFNGSESWYLSNGGMRCQTPMPTDAKSNSADSTLVGAISNEFVEITPNRTWDGASGAGFGIDTNRQLNVCQTGQQTMTVESWKTWLASHNMQIVYPLATPITYNLTPTEVKSLIGINNVWSDAGDMDVEYRADTKLYIDKRLGV